MQYAEIPLPALDGLVKTLWTLRCDGAAGAVVEHDATPDGCLEIIRRLEGRSSWGRAQPAAFVAGLVDRPARLQFSGDAAFVGLRLWPWTWHALGGRPCSAFVNDWIALEDAGLPADLASMFSTLDAAPNPALCDRLASVDDGMLAATGRSILDSATVAALAARCGHTMRGLQRWFQRHVGIARVPICDCCASRRRWSRSRRNRRFWPIRLRCTAMPISRTWHASSARWPAARRAPRASVRAGRSYSRTRLPLHPAALPAQADRPCCNTHPACPSTRDRDEAV